MSNEESRDELFTSGKAISHDLSGIFNIVVVSIEENSSLLLYRSLIWIIYCAVAHEFFSLGNLWSSMPTKFAFSGVYF